MAWPPKSDQWVAERERTQRGVSRIEVWQFSTLPTVLVRGINGWKDGQGLSAYIYVQILLRSERLFLVLIIVSVYSLFSLSVFLKILYCVHSFYFS